MSQYQLGVITPFAIIIGLAIAAALAYALYWAGQWLNSRVDTKLLSRIKVDKNQVDFFSEPSKKELPQHWDAATRFRDALLESPKLYMVATLGWRVLIVRDQSATRRDVGLVDPPTVNPEFLKETNGRSAT